MKPKEVEAYVPSWAKEKVGDVVWHMEMKKQIFCEHMFVGYL